MSQINKGETKKLEDPSHSIDLNEETQRNEGILYHNTRKQRSEL